MGVRGSIATLGLLIACRGAAITPDSGPPDGAELDAASDGQTSSEFSNGAELTDADGADAMLEILEDTTLNSDTGLISTNNVVLRQEGEGVVDGIRVTFRADATVFGLAGLAVSPGATLRVTGTKSVIVVSLGTVVVGGAIDVGAGVCPDSTESHTCPGPGGGEGGTINGVALGCAPGGPGSGDGDTGGGGGGLGEDGGRGGNETDDTMAPGGTPGTPTSPPCPDSTLEPLSGGSGGGRGGGGMGGNGGGGGGALQISAVSEVRVVGSIDAAGEGGGPPAALTNGGGGGGAGGAILLEGGQVTVIGTLAANGGGGGEGGGAQFGERGQKDATPALGGFNGGSAGGNGGYGIVAADNGADGNNDLGGGGGSVGRIHLSSESVSIESDAILTPPATTD